MEEVGALGFSNKKKKKKNTGIIQRPGRGLNTGRVYAYAITSDI